MKQESKSRGEPTVDGWSWSCDMGTIAAKTRSDIAFTKSPLDGAKEQATRRKSGRRAETQIIGAANLQMPSRTNSGSQIL